MTSSGPFKRNHDRATAARFLCAIASVVSIAFIPVHAKEVGWRKAGLWEVAIWKDGESETQAVKVHQCSETKSEPDILLSIVPGQERCSPLKSARSGKSRVVTTQCLVHNTIVKTRLAMEGNFEASYAGGFEVQYLPEVPGVPKPKGMQFRSTWLGACPAGMKSGDMVLSNGITVNVLKDKQEREAAPLFDFRKPPALAGEASVTR